MNEYGLVYENVDLKKYNSYGVGGHAKYLIKPNKDKLKALLEYLEKENIPYYILGSGTNVILPDEDFKGAIIKLDNFNDFKIENDELSAGSGLLLSKVINESFKEGYTNLVNLYGIPGCLGAAIIGNVGSFGSSIFDFVKSVKILDENKEIKVLKKEDIFYTYRSTEFKNRKVIILGATLKLIKGNMALCQKTWQENMAKRKKTQPLDTKNAGSVFKNPEGYAAGKLIEEANLKNKTIGGAKVSDKHANFIINYANAKSCDIIELIDFIKKEIKLKNKIDLELEQIIVKWE